MHVVNTTGAGYSGEKNKWKGCMWNRWRGKKKKCLGEFRYTLVSLVSKTQRLCRPPSCSLLVTPSCSSISSAPACISFHTKDNLTTYPKCVFIFWNSFIFFILNNFEYIFKLFYDLFIINNFKYIFLYVCDYQR